MFFDQSLITSLVTGFASSLIWYYFQKQVENNEFANHIKRIDRETLNYRANQKYLSEKSNKYERNIIETLVKNETFLRSERNIRLVENVFVINERSSIRISSLIYFALGFSALVQLPDAPSLFPGIIVFLFGAFCLFYSIEIIGNRIEFDLELKTINKKSIWYKLRGKQYTNLYQNGCHFFLEDTNIISLRDPNAGKIINILYQFSSFNFLFTYFNGQEKKIKTVEKYSNFFNSIITSIK